MAAVRLGLGSDGRERVTLLFCEWLAWSRFRVVIPVWDRTLATTIGCIDQTLRRIPSNLAVTDPRS